MTTDSNGKLVIEHLPVRCISVLRKSIRATAKEGGYILDGTKYEFEVMQDSQIKYEGKTDPSLTLTLANHKPDLKKGSSGSWKAFGLGKCSAIWQGRCDSLQNHSDYPQKISISWAYLRSVNSKGLKDNKSSISIANLTANTHYEVKANDDNPNGFVIEFKPGQMKDFAGQKVEITYNATLDTGTAAYDWRQWQRQ